MFTFITSACVNLQISSKGKVDSSQERKEKDGGRGGEGGEGWGGVGWGGRVK